MITRSILAIGVAVLVTANPATAQERGTIEFGGFGSYSLFDSGNNMDNGMGLGGRVGAFIFPRLSVEFDLNQKGASRPDGLESVKIEAFAARLTAVPFILGPVSILTGLGIIHTDNQLHETDGLQALLGAKLALNDYVALRLDGVADFNRNKTRNQALQLGVSIYRHPAMTTRTVTVTQMRDAAPAAQRPDSVSAAETRRLRAVEAEHQAMLAANAGARSDAATMAEVIHFAHDRSDLSAAAQSILDSKVSVFRSDPQMRIVITGYASQPGTAAYNMALGLRRAEATKAYLVSRGVAASRVEIATRGQNELVIFGPGERANAANRRGEFRILIAEPGH